jgi:hypothetical protein
MFQLVSIWTEYVKYIYISDAELKIIEKMKVMG